MDPQAAQPPWTLIGALILAISVLAGVVGYLFRIYIGRNKEVEKSLVDKEQAMAKERIDHATEIERMKTEYERKHKEVAEAYATELAEERDTMRLREDALRKDFGDRMERIANEAAETARTQIEVLNKLYERFVGPRRGRTGG